MSGNPSTSSSSSSGSLGSSSGSLGGVGSGGSGDSCIFDFITVLGSPDPAQVAVLSVGDVLSVELQDVPPAVTSSRGGVVVGGVTQQAVRLRSCIQQGFIYEADVISISGGAVQVRVRPA